MSLLKRRGLTPLSISGVLSCNTRKISIANSPFLIPSTPSPTNNSFNSPHIPSFIIVQSPSIFEISSPHLLKTPNSGKNHICPRLNSKNSRHRKYSNISATSIHTPNISPIPCNNCSIYLEDYCSNLTRSNGNDTTNKILNQRFSISPHKLKFSSTSSTDSINLPNNFMKP